MNQPNPERMFQALQAIAGFKVDANTNHAQLSALCIAIAQIAAQEWCCGDAACFNESSGVSCASLNAR